MSTRATATTAPSVPREIPAMIEDSTMKIGRPRQLFIGASPRKFVPVAKRK